MTEYSDFIENKLSINKSSGFDVERQNLNKHLFDWQKDVVLWALRKGKAALFEGCGLGKTIQQLEWARQINIKTNKPVLLLTPLAVSKQTEVEALRFGITNVKVVSHPEELIRGTNITNYEKLDRFNAGDFSGLVCDESSIIKNHSSKFRNYLIEKFHNTPYKLACTATPSPNDHMELGNHSELLNYMTRTEMLAMFFVHDGGETSKWRLKGHAKDKFWRWICNWAVILNKPSDLGYSDDGFLLPPLKYHNKTIATTTTMDGFLFPMEARTLSERRQARRDSLAERVDCAVDIVSSDSSGQWLVWCDLNIESEALKRKIDGSVEVKGSDKDSYKEKMLTGFSSGDVRILVTKSSIAGFGMNWQCCHNIIFVGMSDSFERYYQAIRRCYRFGQKSEVNVYIITSELEGAVVRNIKRKEMEALSMYEGMVKFTKEMVRNQIMATEKKESGYDNSTCERQNWKLINGDCCQETAKLESDSIDYILKSPPFLALYTYSDSNLDMGNSRSDTEFYEHYKFLIKEMYRVLKPGRLVSFHCMNVPAMKERDGYIGLKDFRGDLIKLYQNAGFIHHSEVVIFKDPLIEAVRTKAIGLMHKQLCKDSAMCRQGIPDYVITMRKPGNNTTPIFKKDGFTDYIGSDRPKTGTFSHETWRKYASPVWMDIRQTRTLQKSDARESDDERHIAPLQLDVIERCIHLWTNKGDTVLSPFAGIGSEGYGALNLGRKFIGIELKKSYFDLAIKNLQNVELKQGSLFDLMEK